MNEKMLEDLRLSPNLKNAFISSLNVDTTTRTVNVKIITDLTFDNSDIQHAEKVVGKYVPSYFKSRVVISKLSPDCEMVARSIFEIITKNFKTISIALKPNDIEVKKTDRGFEYKIKVLPSLKSESVCNEISKELKKIYCGEFYGECVENGLSVDDIETQEEHENVEFEIPIRHFDICNFKKLEGDERPDKAVYLSDLNFESEKVVVCGIIEEINPKTYTNNKGQERKYFKIIINDTTARLYVTYFARQKSIEKIEKLHIGDSIVCTGKTEQYHGNISFLANFIDFGTFPENFVPEARASKPVPKYYTKVQPEPYHELSQSDIFSKVEIPECLKGKTFVVFDLETTGLNSVASSGNMDGIIEIAAYKIEDGVIKESFSTFVNPERKLSEEIINLTGITEEMVSGAPTYKEVMPDFYKFCYGSILVGHNIVGFDFKFVDYYCSKLGYMLDRKLIDTIGLSQELLTLSNYKLNTVANKFGIEFNHHRAIDDALVTAKIFIELIKLKKSLPKLQ